MRERTRDAPGVGQVIETVKAADNRVDRAVKLKLRHILSYEQDLVRESVCVALEPRLGQHFLGDVDPGHVIPARGELNSQRTGTAGEVEHTLGLLRGELFELPLDMIRNLHVIDAVQPVVHRREGSVRSIRTHLLRSSLSRTVM